MLTNNGNIPLAVAVWLANDNYDYKSDPKYLSATELLKPIKSVVLSKQFPNNGDKDIADLVPSKVGTAVHNELEAVWTSGAFRKSLKDLGYAQSYIDRFEVNPDKDLIMEPETIPVYLERRSFAVVNDWTIGGKFDIVMDGKLSDYKTTKVWGFMSGSNDSDYIRQASMYRWLNPDIITEDIMSINYIFTDWNKVKSKADPKYPNQPAIEKDYPLDSLSSIETFVLNKIKEVEALMTLPQSAMPDCTPDQLWQSDPVWKYYKNPAKVVRATKNFDNSADAYQRLAADGNVGIVIEVKGEVKRCHYCNARPVCLQAEQLELAGLLV